MHIANLTKVCTPSLRLGRSQIKHSSLPRIRYLSASHLHRHHPRLPLRRQLGPQDLLHRRRFRTSSLHVHHGLTLRGRRRARGSRRRTLGRHRHDLPLRASLQRYLGRLLPGLRLRNPEPEDEGWRCESGALGELGC